VGLSFRVPLSSAEENTMTELQNETVSVPSILTRLEVAKICRLSVRTVLRMDADGRLKSVRFGRAIRYRASDVAALIAAA
jgi:excisionase family DNA binding protein